MFKLELLLSIFAKLAFLALKWLVVKMQSYGLWHAAPLLFGTASIQKGIVPILELKKREMVLKMLLCL